jgi:hypothetical protein
MVDNPSGHGILSLAQAWLPILTVVGGALWGHFTYLDQAKEAAKIQAASEQKLADERKSQSERDSRTRLIEAQKAFLDKQLALYVETSQVVGRLVAEDAVGQDPFHLWKMDLERFEELYWSELTMVEHSEVASAMVEFRAALQPVAEKYFNIAPVPIGKENEEFAAVDRNGLRDSALTLSPTRCDKESKNLGEIAQD